MKTIDLGTQDYFQVLELQEQTLKEIQAGGEPVLFLVEHPPVITLGRHSDGSNIIVSRDELAREGIQVCRTKRGGDVTCHYPGQLVAYPIFRIDRRCGGVKRFFHDLEEVIIKVLFSFGLSANRQPGLTGVFIGKKKIASLGIGVRKWVSFHGLALNVSGNINLFDAIVPCGLESIAMTSMHHELGDVPPDMKNVKNRMRDVFKTMFPDS